MFEYRTTSAVRRVWRYAASAMLLTNVLVAHAAVFCVGTEVALRNALSTAASNADTRNTIYIQAGTINITGSTGYDGLYYYSAATKSLSILGGRNSACTASGGITTLDAGNHTNILRILTSSTSSVLVQEIVFAHGNSQYAMHGSALTVEGSGSVTVQLDQFIANSAAQSAMALDVAANVLRVNNNLFVANAGQMFAAARLGAKTGLVNGNTIVANRDTDPSTWNSHVAVFLRDSGMDDSVPGKFYLSNNILWDNTADVGGSMYDVYSLLPMELRNNDIGSYTGIATINTGNMSVDPDFQPSWFISVQLAPGSPLVNAGLDSPPGGTTSVDLAGLPRIIGPHIDIGAYELRY